MNIIPSFSNQNLKDLLWFLINQQSPSLLSVTKESLSEGLFDETPVIKDIISNILESNEIYVEKLQQNNIILSKPEISIESFLDLIKSKLKLYKYLKYSNNLQAGLETASSYSDILQHLDSFYDKLYIDSFDFNNNSDILISDNSADSLKEFLSFKNINIIPSGYPKLDLCLNGGFYPVRTYVIVGQSGGGKSTFLRNIALNIVNSGKKVFFATLEMTAQESLICFLSTQMRVPVEVLINAIKKNDTRITKLILSALSVLKNKLYIKEYLDSHNVFDLIRDIKKIKQEFDFSPDIIIIDYADYYTAADKWADFGRVYDTLKSIERKFNVPIVTASQANRESYIAGGETQLSHIANSLEKVKKAECVLLIRESPLEHSQNIFRLYIGKNRFGKSKLEIAFDFNKDILSISERGFVNT